MVVQVLSSATDPFPTTDVVVSVEDVSKKFCRDLKRSLFYGVRDIATDLRGGKRRGDQLRSGEFWALQNVSFQLRRGEALGLVGSNGAGKSTLLRIISGLIKPDTGVVRGCGRIAPLIALGAGFNPILTGRENIYANMSLLGLSTQEIKRQFDAVVEFAEIQAALDAPVQTYSSGMAARLGFACAIYTKPDILLIDEVLAVGDVRFKMKCRRRLAELREQGTAFILVSHNPYHILNVCEKSVYLKQGQVVLVSDSQAAIRQYEADLKMDGIDRDFGYVKVPRKPAEESSGLDITSIYFQDSDNQPLSVLKTGEPATFCIECESDLSFEDVNVGVLISSTSEGGDRVLTISSNNDGERVAILPGTNRIRIKMPQCCLLPGIYSANIYVKKGIYSLDRFRSFRFKVEADRSTSRCFFYQPRTWELSY